MVSEDHVFHSLHAGGPPSSPSPSPNTDIFEDGSCEQGSCGTEHAAGFFWMHSTLFVDDHPYYAATDAEGRFRLSEVPSGSYEIVCWHPNWREERREYDPESRQAFRLFFQQPLETVRPLRVKTGEILEVAYEFKM